VHAPAAATKPVLEAQDLQRHYRIGRGLFKPAALLKAVAGASFSLTAGRTLAVVGESGCGKSTLARMVTMIERPTSGHLMIDGTDTVGASKQALHALRPKVQMVFQDPYGSLDPRRTVAQTVAEPLALLHRAGRAEQRERALEVLDAVGLRATDLDKYPHEFSGGQRQRIAIARALITRPQLIVADEPVSALDVSVQAQVLNLMQDLQDRYRVTYLFISHDLAVVDLVCDDVLVLQHGVVVERGATREVFGDPQHEYTRTLLAAAQPG
jgi:ABC-type microcin C transport system duplicated ATPase subunit YejF